VSPVALSALPLPAAQHFCFRLTPTRRIRQTLHASSSCSWLPAAFSDRDGHRDEVLRVEGRLRLALAVVRGPAVLAPGERRPVLRDGAAVQRRAPVELRHGRRVSVSS